MAEAKTPGPWDRLQSAAREAMDKFESEFANVTSGKWDDDDAMQVYKNLHCALQDIEETKVKADAAPDLLAVCEKLLRHVTDGTIMCGIVAGMNLDKTKDEARAAIVKATTA